MTFEISFSIISTKSVDVVGSSITCRNVLLNFSPMSYTNKKLQQDQNESNGSVNETDVNESQSGLSSAPDDVALLIQQLLDDKKDHFVVLDETQQSLSQDEKPGTARRLATVDLSADLGELYAVKNEYSVQLIAPQIQLQSQKNVDAAVIMSAEKHVSSNSCSHGQGVYR